MGTDTLLSAAAAGTGVALLMGGAGWVARRHSSALANSLWRGALAVLWLAPIAALASEALHAHPQPLRLPLLPTPRVASRPAAIPPELVQPAQAVAQVSMLGPKTAEQTQSAPLNASGRSALLSPGLLLVLVWIAGAMLGAALLLRDVWRIEALVRRSSPVTDPGVCSRVARWSRAVGIRKAPLVARWSAVPIPTVVGWMSPRLLLNGERSLSDDELNAVIVHELAHIRRADLLVHLLARFTRVLWWWNPATFVIAHELRRTAEEACDDWAVSLTSKAGAYARLLVRWAEAAGVAGGAACAEPGGMLVARVKRILQPGREPRPDAPRWARTFLPACVGVAILLAATVSLRAAPDDLVVEDFSELRAGRWAGGIEFAEGEDGQGLGHWFAARNGDHLELKDVPADWTRFEYIELWMWSAAANSQTVMLLVYTHGDDPNGMDYYSRRMVVDWRNWKRIRVPLSAFRRVRGGDWGAVRSFALSTTGWDIEPLEDTDLFIDEIRLLEEIPREIAEALAQVRETFMGSGGLEGLGPGMVASLKRHAGEINTILEYGGSSDEEAERLARDLSGPLREYAERFKPGREIDDEWLKPRTTRWAPEHGLNVDAYLLLELAKRRPSPAFTRGAFALLNDTMAAHSNLVDRRTLYRHPELADEAARERRAIGPPVGNLGREIAWCCEQFMVQAYLAEEAPLPDAAMDVVTEFWKWRKERMLAWGGLDSLDELAYNTTMDYVKQLIELLPAE